MDPQTLESIISRDPGIPRPSPVQSYWQTPPSDISHHRTTSSLPSHSDIIIIGSGISGATIAYNLLSHFTSPSSSSSTSSATTRNSPTITLLEARTAASGASGRNGGHTKHASYRKFIEDVHQAGVDDAIKIACLEWDCMQAVHAFIREHEILCDAEMCDTVDVYYDAEEFEFAKKSVAMMKADRKLAGEFPEVVKYQFYDGEETAREFKCPGSLGSVRYLAGKLSAYKLTIGILKMAVEMGLNLQTETAALKVEKVDGGGDGGEVVVNGTTRSEANDGKWSVMTSRGTITTNTLVLATNGYTPHLYRPLQGTIIPFRGVVTAQRPGSNMPQGAGLPTTYSFCYSGGFDYMISLGPNVSSSSSSSSSSSLSSASSTPQSSISTNDSSSNKDPDLNPDLGPHAGDIIIGGGLTKSPGNGTSEFGNTDDTTIDPLVNQYLKDSLPTFFGRENWGHDVKRPSTNSNNVTATNGREEDDSQRVRQSWSGIMGYSADGYPLVGPVPGEEGLWIDASFQGHGMVLCFLCARAMCEMLISSLHSSTATAVESKTTNTSEPREKELDSWFPRCFLVTKERIEKKFTGFGHVPDVADNDIISKEKGKKEVH